MPDGPRLPLRLLRGMVRGGTLAAVACLVVEFGFFLDPTLLAVLHGVEIAVVALFVIEVAVAWATASDRRAHTKRRWLEIGLVALLAGVAALLPFLARGRDIARVYLVLVQLFLALRLAISVLRANERLIDKVRRPAWILVGSFLVLIAVGAALLMMPRCRAGRAAPITASDALFTATSAACVTGLAVRDTGTDFSMRGQAVILGLIQIGGLGLVTFALVMSYLQRRALQLRQVTLLRDLISVQALGGLGPFLTYTLVSTFVIELAGAAVLFHALEPARLDIADRAWWAVFHSVSAFCNAGFALQGDSLTPWARSLEVNAAIGVLIVLGGLGFPVLLNLLQFEIGGLGFIRRWQRGLAGRGMRAVKHLTVHTKLVLVMTGVLILIGAALFHIAEAENPATLGTLEPPERVMASVFQSVTARTAGFNTVEFGRLHLPTLMLIMVLMAIGASPISTGGGMKTSTVAVMGLTLRSMIRDRDHVEVFGRTIPRGIVNASVAIVVLYVSAVVVIVTALVATQENVLFIEALFESVSAASTVGLSTGVTARLNGTGRIIIGAAMLVGRVGPLAIIWTVLSRPPAMRYQYPEEAVVVS